MPYRHCALVPLLPRPTAPSSIILTLNLTLTYNGTGARRDGSQWDGKGRGWEYSGSEAQWDARTIGGPLQASVVVSIVTCVTSI